MQWWLSVYYPGKYKFLVTHRWKRDLKIAYYQFLNFKLVDGGSV